MAKREADAPEFQWESPEEAAEAEESAAEFQQSQGAPTPRPGFHLIAARRIEEARERRLLRKALEDFDDYDV
jgi:alkanesulfonate monooxygenase SsuD/methylene tetrahydromethanopterin reductase-like flavin-dependent oxidoreductase (luciferase family)